MTEISKLFVTIGAKTQDFEKGLAGVQKNLDKAGKVMIGIGAAIVGAAALSIKSYVDVGDEIHKMGLRTGFAAETLSRLRYAAQIGGTSLASLETGVKRMQRVIVDAGRGMETYARTFDALGLSIDDIMAMDPEGQFLTIAAAIAEIEDPTLRAALAQEIFGRSGTDLLPILADGAAGLNEVMQAADRLGVVMDEEAAEKAARLQDAMTDVKTAMLGVKLAVAESLVPALTPMIEQFADIVAWIGKWVKENPDLTKGIISFGLALLGLGAAIITISKVYNALRGLAIAAATVKAMMGPKGWVMLLVGLALAAGAAALLGSKLLKPEPIEYYGEGGIVDRPTLAMIGEKGPEAVVPLDKGFGTTINISQMVVREEADIHKIARELERQRQLRARYV